MNVLFISRNTLFSAPGGDTIQIKQTSEYLKQFGINADIKLASDTIDYSHYKLLHFFNIIRPADIIYHVQKSSLPFVISTIFVDYSEFERKSRKGLVNYLSRLLGSDQVEYLKVIARYFLNNEKIRSKKYILWGHTRSIRYLLNNSALLLPNSESEYCRVFRKFGIKKKYSVIPNAIDHRKFARKPVLLKEYENAVICVARIEGLKNQLNLIRALNNTDYKLFIIGNPSPNNKKYYNICKKESAANVHFISHVDQEQLIDIYFSSKVHVLPSWFETTGLSSLEAAFMGCNIVITDKGDQKEYFRDFAFYCDPENKESILEAVNKAYHTPYNTNIKEYILSHYTWEIAAKKTYEAYLQILK
jgi:glycosyltransferase involved in cell wall biosynthesis